jgi:multiple sugar transport system ATP-binding protein
VLNLTNYLDRRPGQLSGGQRQRVAIGRAIVREPAAFLFDEPLSNLDAALRVTMRQEISELHQKLKTTMIYVTHDQVEAMTMADKIVVLNAGNIEQVGSAAGALQRPANLFVAGFIGSPKMNFITGPRRAKYGATTIGVRPEHVEVSKDRAAAGRARSAGRTSGLGHLPQGGLKRVGEMTVRANGEMGLHHGDTVYLARPDPAPHPPL